PSAGRRARRPGAPLPPCARSRVAPFRDRRRKTRVGVRRRSTRNLRACPTTRYRARHSRQTRGEGGAGTSARAPGGCRVSFPALRRAPGSSCSRWSSSRACVSCHLLSLLSPFSAAMDARRERPSTLVAFRVEVPARKLAVESSFPAGSTTMKNGFVLLPSVVMVCACSAATGEGEPGLVACAPGPAVATGSQAVAAQIDVAHSGAQPADRLSLPLCERWSVDVGSPALSRFVVEGPVIACPASALRALDVATG